MLFSCINERNACTVVTGLKAVLNAGPCELRAQEIVFMAGSDQDKIIVANCIFVFDFRPCDNCVFFRQNRLALP